VPRIWQKIEGTGQICHWWQDSDERRIAAMNEILIATTFLIALLAGLAALVHFARADSFAGPGTAYRPHDELGSFGLRRRQH